jgi:hypothetical protein
MENDLVGLIHVGHSFTVATQGGLSHVDGGIHHVKVVYDLEDVNCHPRPHKSLSRPHKCRQPMHLCAVFLRFPAFSLAFMLARGRANVRLTSPSSGRKRSLREQ